ncbi:2Fe-2S iron-sulfur cluster binding domain-containing protein [Synechococcus sp. CS-1325]|uniref:2Fe-2S iron-sulfur cluster binding domain-containing protein n=1 Tax=unclassified Synechococcus TaxID=2626047 RepID=UPI000DB3B357|nr:MULTISPECIES: 2Fe-2S iron-sulfur cluster-binding protein [unclassified Synechococcus]MCT0199267.1 2Fe-2S iron-sulfur cluster binding domain-containing protein [Synechococcus sp. CS-1325]MCT0214339.1 2Fe-2S iron-sulfur cluster binding domain-containing protein [Synechococcus sp. CS-1326]MCT0234503.1 2Fe-2S iron-sulfur cluster binding domain-containing protein [Synechococcus sp. CS-1327]PZU98675.1 MAG: (2Fe-2S)-binding protein [Cyanobium sp.]
MAPPLVRISWPNGSTSLEPAGTAWLSAAASGNLLIPTGCLGGSCGACEIEVNGQVVRACIASVPPAHSGELRVELASDPYW